MKNDFIYADEMLLKVSRTFALNINILSGELRTAVLLAYLYLRIADTIEDDAILVTPEKERLLSLFASVFDKKNNMDERLSMFIQALPPHFQGVDNPNYDLTIHAKRVVPLLKTLPEKYISPILEVVQKMCGGMISFIKKQNAFDSWFTLKTIPDLDEYCFYVAGIVGQMLTKVFYARHPRLLKSSLEKMKQLDVSFGLALQITNIIKDVKEDAERQVCFIPEEIYKKYGFSEPSELFEGNFPIEKKAKVLDELIEKAWKHIDDGVNYILLLPRHSLRIRLFCLWPLLMAAENLKVLKHGFAVFESEQKAKISRTKVRQILKSSTFHFYSNTWIKKTFQGLHP